MSDGPQRVVQPSSELLVSFGRLLTCPKIQLPCPLLTSALDRLDIFESVVLVAQLCLTLCDPMDYSPPGSSVRRILQARKLEWVGIPFSRGSSRPRAQNSGLLHWQAVSLSYEPAGTHERDHVSLLPCPNQATPIMIVPVLSLLEIGVLAS